MASLKRRILGITVISAGVCAALPFRSETVTAPLDTRAAVELSGATTPRNDLTLQLTIPTAPSSVRTTVDEQQLAPVVADPKPMPQPQEVLREDLQAPPALAATFKPLVDTFSVATAAATPTADDRPELLHRIIDGDTLEKIAERYLGSRSEWRSIFAANHTVLTDPDVLPIGKEIKIPPNVEASRDDGVDHLVPIPAGLLNRGE